MALKDVTPYDEKNQPGLVFIMDETKVLTWVEKNVQALVDEGYKRIVVTDHIPYAEREAKFLGEAS